MKVILSRKGFDSGYGGYPSPILPNGELISLPIPDFNKDICFSNLQTNEGISYSNLIENLVGSQIKFEGNGRVNVKDIGCHFDPDIKKCAYTRSTGWRPLFGQAGSAQSHLRNQSVGIGDLFLFFGWFRNTVKSGDGITFDKLDKVGKHIIYGYFQVGEIHRVNEMQAEDWMLYHPHVSRGKSANDNDYVYVATDTLTFDKNLPGAGVFNYSEELVLTKDGYSRTKWNLPDTFRDISISYHSDKSWKDDYFQSAAKGQEFVIEENKDIEEWAMNLVCSRAYESSFA